MCLVITCWCNPSFFRTDPAWTDCSHRIVDPAADPSDCKPDNLRKAGSPWSYRRPEAGYSPEERSVSRILGSPENFFRLQILQRLWRLRRVLFGRPRWVVRLKSWWIQGSCLSLHPDMGNSDPCWAMRIPGFRRTWPEIRRPRAEVVWYYLEFDLQKTILLIRVETWVIVVTDTVVVIVIVLWLLW